MTTPTQWPTSGRVGGDSAGARNYSSKRAGLRRGRTRHLEIIKMSSTAIQGGIKKIIQESSVHIFNISTLTVRTCVDNLKCGVREFQG